MPAFFFKLVCYLVRLLPVRLAGAIGAGIGRLAYFLDKRHRSIALRNLNRIYPERGTAWHRRIARESFAELGRSMFEMPHVFLRSKEFLLSRINTKGLAEVRRHIDSGTGIIYTACHHSNWELGALMPSLYGLPCSQLYRSVRQKPLDAILKGWRERFGNRLHSRDENMRWLPRALKQGQIAGIMIDQHLSNGVPVPFLGHLANSTTLPAVYARKHHTPVFAVILHRISRDFRFQAEFRQVDFPEASDNQEQDLIDYTRTISDCFADAINRRPELWLWVHRRWLLLDEREAGMAA